MIRETTTVIAFLNGVLEEKQPTRVVVDVGGVGYEVFIPLSSYDGLPARGESCRLFTFQYVREDVLQLFGFVTEVERRVFHLLLGVSGVGPKLALGVLSGLTARDVQAAIAEGDVKRLSSVSGVGKKTAERIVLELRDKLTAGEALEAIAGGDRAGKDTHLRDAVLALVALGYKQEAARKMVMAVLPVADKGKLSVEDVVKSALGRKG